MADLHIKPAELKKFAASASTQARALQNQLHSVTIPDTAFGTFDEATLLAGRLNQQLSEVQARLSASMNILRSLAQAADLAAGMVGQSDAVVERQMKSINKVLNTAEQTLARAPQPPQGEQNGTQPTPAQHGGARPV